MSERNERYEDLLRRYAAKVERELWVERVPVEWSKEYKTFKQETVPALSRYESLCHFASSIFTVSLSEADRKKLSKAIEVCHLDVRPEETVSLSYVVFLGVILVSVLTFTGIYLITETFFILPFSFALLFGLFAFYYTSTLPYRIERRWRLKAGSQFVPCILYVIVFMRHTPNLELAIKFASRHLGNPLALDLRKVFWDVETAKYPTMRESLAAYLERWRETNLEFVEAFHLIESSLYEPVEERRVGLLEKSLSVILDGVHERMLHYVHDIRGPLTSLYMLGIVLPTLALALLPLGSALVGELVNWPLVLFGFNVLIPLGVFYMTASILEKRPGGHGERELLEQTPGYEAYVSKTPYYKAAIVALPLFLLGILPLVFGYTPLPDWFGLKRDYTFAELGIPLMPETKVFGFYAVEGKLAGPYGPLALLLSLFVPLSIAIFFILAYSEKTKLLTKTRRETKKLEVEFSSSIFQLGARLADGIPAEMAFGRVASALRGTPSGRFYSAVDRNIRQAGMSVRDSIFSPTRGAILEFPSRLVRTSMEILIESVRKGLDVAAKALTSISNYMKNIHAIDERLRDLMADIVSGMRSNMAFLAPMLAGIVVGLAAMIATILDKLRYMLEAGFVTEETAFGALGTVGALTEIFELTKTIPPYWLQIIVGVYLIEIVFILTSTLVTIESGTDRLKEKADTATNLGAGIGMYFVVALVSILALSLLAGMAIGGMAFA